jgi:hypothetical protein
MAVLQPHFAPPIQPGDFNDDGAVDAADYVLWRDGGPLLNETVTIGTVDDADYMEWRANFGNSAVAVSSVGVPEPMTVVMVLLGTACFLALRRRS